MTTNADAYEAAVDAVLADNTLNMNGFENAIQTVATGITNPEADAWVTAIFTEYERLGIINNPTYGNLRGEIINEGKTVSMALFEALAVSINSLAESVPVNEDVRKIDLRADRDEINTSIDTLQVFIDDPAATRQVKDALRIGINELRSYKQRIRDELQSLNEQSPPDP